MAAHQYKIRDEFRTQCLLQLSSNIHRCIYANFKPSLLHIFQITYLLSFITKFLRTLAIHYFSLILNNSNLVSRTTTNISCRMAATAPSQFSSDFPLRTCDFMYISTGGNIWSNPWKIYLHEKFWHSSQVCYKTHSWSIFPISKGKNVIISEDPEKNLNN